MNLKLFFAAIFLFVTASGCRQNSGSVEISPAVVYFPTRVVAGEQVEVNFRVVNNASSPIVLTRIETSCGCLKSEIQVEEKFVNSGVIQPGETVGRIQLSTHGRRAGENLFEFALWLLDEDNSKEFPLVGGIVVNLAQGVVAFPSQLEFSMEQQFVGLYGDVDKIDFQSFTPSHKDVEIRDVTDHQLNFSDLPVALESKADDPMTLRCILAITLDKPEIDQWRWVDVAYLAEGVSKHERINILPSGKETGVKIEPSSLVFFDEFSSPPVRRVVLKGFLPDSVKLELPSDFADSSLAEMVNGTEIYLTFKQASRGKSFEMIVRNQSDELICSVPITVLTGE